MLLATFSCPPSPSYHVGNFCSVFLCPTVHTVCSLDCPDPSLPLFISMLIAWFSGPQAQWHGCCVMASLHPPTNSRKWLCWGLSDFNQWEFCPPAPVGYPQRAPRFFQAPAAAAASAPPPSGSPDPFGWKRNISIHPKTLPLKNNNKKKLLGIFGVRHSGRQ